VSAVATILGLLLVVTFIANYITTTLPNTMGQNDLQHEVMVENQVAQLGGVLQEAAQQGVVGAQISGPVTLGSAGAPPFAGQDPSTITPLANRSLFTVSFTLTGPSASSFGVSYSTRSTSCGTSFCAGAGFVVHLRNTYATSGEVAYEQGAVVYAQSGGIPVFISTPSITNVSGVLTIFLPQFLNNTVNTEAGVGTADVSLRLLSVVPLTVPAGGFSLKSGTPVTATITTPYAAAWAAYFLSVPALKSFVSCLPTSCATLANTIYIPGGSPGTVTLTVPAAKISAFHLVVGVYSFALS
jgi:hypothetical protein